MGSLGSQSVLPLPPEQLELLDEDELLELDELAPELLFPLSGLPLSVPASFLGSRTVSPAGLLSPSDDAGGVQPGSVSALG